MDAMQRHLGTRRVAGTLAIDAIAANSDSLNLNVNTPLSMTKT